MVLENPGMSEFKFRPGMSWKVFEFEGIWNFVLECPRKILSGYHATLSYYFSTFFNILKQLW